MHYDLTDLRLFVAIAEEGNLTRGAARAFLAPSSASHRLQRLEAALGAQLFERQARGVQLTRAGETLLRNARQVLAALEQMHANLSPFASGIRGHVSLWANTHATHTFLPDDLASFLRQHPQVSVTLEERTSGDIALAVAHGEIELGVLADSSTIDASSVDLLSYRRDRLVLITPQDPALAGRCPALLQRWWRICRCAPSPWSTLRWAESAGRQASPSSTLTQANADIPRHDQ